MTSKAQGGPTHRAAATVAAGAAAAIAAVAALAWSLLLAFVVALLTLMRGFLFYSLALVAIGGVAVAGVLSWGHHWQDAGSALLAAFGAAVLLAAYGAVALRLNPSFFRRDRIPWWWMQ